MCRRDFSRCRSAFSVIYRRHQSIFLTCAPGAFLAKSGHKNCHIITTIELPPVISVWGVLLGPRLSRSRSRAGSFLSLQDRDRRIGSRSYDPTNLSYFVNKWYTSQTVLHFYSTSKINSYNILLKMTKFKFQTPK